jgi:hypothetical protein
MLAASMRRSATIALLLAATSLAAQPTLAERTKLLEVDLKTGAVRRIDASGPKTAADRDLDALLDKSTGASFSTDDLEKIEKAMRRFLEAARPRAMPRLMLFVYPGRISRSGLKELREVKVDIDLVVDPCSRTICTDAVGKHVELLGKALRQATLRTSRYTVRFGTVNIRTSTEMNDTQYDAYRFSAEEVVQAGQRAGGGAALVGRLSQAKEGYARQMTKEVAARVKARRVRLSKPPVVQRDARSVSVDLEIASDRVRYKTDVLGAFAGTAEALRKSPLTPTSSTLRLVATIPFKAVEHRSFSCTGQALGLFLDGKMSQSEIWSTYIVEKKKGGKQLTFDDDEASGRKATDDDDDGAGDDRTNEVLSGHFNLLAPCLSAEAARNRSFRGATLRFSIASTGKAGALSLRESSSATLRACLQGALEKIRFPKHRGAPRQVQFPMVIKR